jgi:hypothetical protein
MIRHLDFDTSYYYARHLQGLDNLCIIYRLYIGRCKITLKIPFACDDALMIIVHKFSLVLLSFLE